MKKAISLLLIIVMVCSMGTIAFASAEINKNSQISAMSVIDKINAEYGVDFSLPSETMSGRSSVNIQITPEVLKQFEEELRVAAKEISEENAKAEELWEKALSQSDVQDCKMKCDR